MCGGVGETLTPQRLSRTPHEALSAIDRQDVAIERKVERRPLFVAFNGARRADPPLIFTHRHNVAEAAVRFVLVIPFDRENIRRALLFLRKSAAR